MPDYSVTRVGVSDIAANLLSPAIPVPSLTTFTDFSSFLLVVVEGFTRFAFHPFTMSWSSRRRAMRSGKASGPNNGV